VHGKIVLGPRAIVVDSREQIVSFNRASYPKNIFELSVSADTDFVQEQHNAHNKEASSSPATEWGNMFRDTAVRECAALN
jgi:hypothetical protein